MLRRCISGHPCIALADTHALAEPHREWIALTPSALLGNVFADTHALADSHRQWIALTDSHNAAHLRTATI